RHGPRRAAAELARRDHASAVLEHAAAHGVESDTAAGELVRLGARGKAGRAHQLDEPIAIDRRGLGEQAELDRTGAHAIEVDTAAIVLDDEHERVVSRATAQPDLSGRRLAGRGALRRRLDAVIDRVAYEMERRDVDRREHLGRDLTRPELERDLDL